MERKHELGWAASLIRSSVLPMCKGVYVGMLEDDLMSSYLYLFDHELIMAVFMNTFQAWNC